MIIIMVVSAVRARELLHFPSYSFLSFSVKYSEWNHKVLIWRNFQQLALYHGIAYGKPIFCSTKWSKCWIEILIPTNSMYQDFYQSIVLLQSLLYFNHRIIIVILCVGTVQFSIWMIEWESCEDVWYMTFMGLMLNVIQRCQ